MPERAEATAAFLAARGWGAAARAPLAGDASFRRYERLTDGARRAVLMDAPPPMEDIRPFLLLARHLRGLGLSAPGVLAADEAAGLALVEDLGDLTYTRLLDGAKAPSEAELYALAVDVLVALHRLEPARAVPAGLPPYDDRRLLDEALLLVDWYWPALAGARPDGQARESYVETWLSLFPLVRRVPETLVLRDYHVDNLMWLPGRAGVARCGLLDFQDAMAGPVAYDLVSLLEDARRDVPAALRAEMRRRYLAAFPGLDRGAFDAAYAVLGAQRNAKIVGIFTRLCVRDGKAQYLAHIPRVWRLLEGDLANPALAPVRAWFARHLPPGMRRVPECRPAA
ncbi:MAG: phosphotransferase [Proteobacteria bacterium]|nr:phosphotransferase [Pseudomonadota bacterium]